MRNTYLVTSLLLAVAAATAICTAQTGINLNRYTPAAPAGTRNATFQNDLSIPTRNVSAYVTYPTIQVACPSSGDLSGPVSTAFAVLNAAAGGIIDARACTGATSWNNAITITQANTSLLLPCATLTVTQPLTVSPGVRNTAVHGCNYQGGSAASGTAGGTVWNWQGSNTAMIVGDTADASDTGGFMLTDLAFTTPSAGASAHAISLHRVQEADIERVYFIGNNSTGQTAITLDGKGNYTGGQFIGLHIASFGVSLLMTGDNTGGANASTFVRLHIDCPTSAGSPISGTYGINLAYGDGNTFSGGDVEGCDTMLALGAGAANNTFIGVRNENSNSQVVASTGSSYNLWETGGTMFTGSLTDGGTHNTFWDAFHRQFNNLNGDLWRSQADQTVTNHLYTGIGLGHVRGLQEEYVTDVPGSPSNYQNAWLWGPGDGTTGAQVWVLTDLLRNMPRFGASQTTAGSGNDQTFLNATGTASVCVNCSAGAGTGGFSVASGGATPVSVWASDGSGDTTQNGYMRFWASGVEAWRFDCAATTACGVNSYTTGISHPHIRMFQGTGTELDSEGSAAVTVNNTSASGTGGFIVYEGGSNSSVAAFTVTSTGTWSSGNSGQVGSASGTGNLVIGNHLNQLATADFAGHCNMSGTANCGVSFQHSWTSIPACAITPQFNAGGTFWYTWATNVVTVHSSGTPTGLWAVVCAGDPN